MTTTIPRALLGSVRRAAPRVLTPARRQYATPGYSERRDKTLKTSSRLTWQVISINLPLQHYTNPPPGSSSPPPQSPASHTNTTISRQPRPGPHPTDTHKSNTTNSPTWKRRNLWKTDMETRSRSTRWQRTRTSIK
jgi:hypothetical protein